ncbi:MAG: hexitol phosphatase HxpB [Bacteroidales bacterium]|nr:hexitol phosphatase HxpB [Bacteroidales bacterium]
MKGVIFDMDGLLIDSEPLWQQAEVKVFNAIGVPMTVDMCRQVMGIRIEEVVDHWYRIYQWKGKSQDQVVAEIMEEMEQLIKTQAKALPGVKQTLELCREKGLKIALASSSASRIINTSLEALGIKDRFEVIRSAENEEYGKPHPGIYISTLKDMGLNYSEAFVFEDSFNGAIAAKAARLKVVVVPEARQYDDPKWGFADVRLRSLSEFGGEELDLRLRD